MKWWNVKRGDEVHARERKGKGDRGEGRRGIGCEAERREGKG